MVNDRREPAEPARPDNAVAERAFDRAEVIRRACLDRCDEMSNGGYDFGPPLTNTDRILTITVAAAFLAIMYLGYLV